MELAARQLLRAIRGDHRSQVAFARKLGYRGNPIGDWEAGRRSPTASEALRACQVAGIDVPGAFSRFHPARLTFADQHWQVGVWLTVLAGNTSIAELARRAGASRHQISRWLKGAAIPRLPEFLILVEALTGRSCELVGELVPIEKVPCMLSDYERLTAARRLAHDEPWTEAILRIIETGAYQKQDRHRPGRIAAALGVTLETESRCLEKLEQVDILRRNSAGLYTCVRSLTVDTRAVPLLKVHWYQAASERAHTPGPDDVFCYNVLTASEADLDRIADLLIATYRQVRLIVKNTPADEGAALVNLQLVRWRL